MRFVKLSFESSPHLAVDEVKVFWKKASLPVRNPQRSVDEVENLYEKYRKIQKSQLENSNKSEERDWFFRKLNMFFDIALQSILEDSKVLKEAKEFLINQRKITREGCFVPVRTYFDE